jgi:hypothetical protein
MYFNYFRKIILIHILFYVCSTGVESQPIPINVLRNKTIVPVKVGQSRTLDILLDTGMSFDGLLIYNPDLTDSIILNNGMKIQLSGAGKGKPTTAMMDTSAQFTIGDFEFKNQKLLLLQNDMYKGFPSDGVLGYSIFGHFAVEIDYDKNVMMLHDDKGLTLDESWDSIPIYFKKNTIPWIDVSIVIENEVPVRISTYIDFAAGETIELLEKVGMKFTLPKNLQEAYLGRGLSGDIYGKKGTIKKLMIGKYELNNINAAVAPAAVRSKQENADAVIGSGSLRHFNLIFDYHHKKLFLKPNSFFTSMN